MVPLDLPAVLRFGQWALSLRRQHDVLVEIAQLLVLVRCVELDDVLQRMHLGQRSERPEILVQVVLELVEQHIQLAVVELPERRNRRRIDDDRARALEILDGCVCQRIASGAGAKQPVADDADARAAKAVSYERLGVVARSAFAGPKRRRVGGIGPGHRGEQKRRVGHRPRHRPGGVLAVGNRHDAGPADEPERRLDADERIDL